MHVREQLHPHPAPMAARALFNRFSRLEAASDVLSVAKPTESAASLFLRLPMLHAYIAYRACTYDYV